jgi:hypothetical protein
VPGSGITDESDSIIEAFIKDRNIPLHTYGAMNAGDATLHLGWTLHCAPDNPTPTMREVMTIIYFADSTKALDPEGNQNRENDLATWLPGIKAGELAASKLNPLI